MDGLFFSPYLDILNVLLINMMVVGFGATLFVWRVASIQKRLSPIVAPDH